MSRSLVLVAAVVAATATATAHAQTLTEAQVQRRHHVRMMEGVLVGAAQHGAELFGRRVAEANPDLVLLSSTVPRARGFVLDGYGVFFDVEIPGVKPSVAWAMQTIARDLSLQQAINDLRRYVGSISDSRQRADLEQAMRRLELQLGGPASASPVQTTGQAVAAADIVERAAAAADMRDPFVEYTTLVKQSLKDAMLDYSGSLAIANDEWLAIAARDSEGPLLPNVVFDNTVTITLRIRGADLADYRAGRITRDEALARIEVREF